MRQLTPAAQHTMPPTLKSLVGRRSGGDVVGLDIQPGVVAAVKARVNGGIVVERAAVRPPPADAVREGEVIDRAALSETLRELFDHSGLGKRVRVGVANQRTVMRTLDWGALARFWVLDGRQYRSDQACGDGILKVPCGNWADPSRTMLGRPQEQWLARGMAASHSRWQVLANQTMLATVDSAAGPDVVTSMDSWGGYPAAQARLVKTIADTAPNRTVVITGDNHANWVNEIRMRGTMGTHDRVSWHEHHVGRRRLRAIQLV